MSYSTLTRGGEWRSAVKSKADLAKYQQVARATFRKDKRVNIRIRRRFSRNSKAGVNRKDFLLNVDVQYFSQILGGDVGGKSVARYFSFRKDKERVY